MDDRKLETLLTAIRKGSFSKAAEELCCTQSAVAQSMNVVEAEFGFELFNRTHNGISLSQKGEKLLPFIIQADQALRLLQKEADNIAAGKEAPIRIGTFSSIANTWLPKIIRNYQREHPEADFEISIGTKDIMQWMLDGELDMALCEESIVPAFRWYPLYSENYYAVLREDMVFEDQTSISQEKLLEYNLLLGTVLTLDEKLLLPAKRKTLVRSDDDYILVNMVSQGMGITILPQQSLKSMGKLPDNIVLLDMEPSLKRTIGLGIIGHPSASVKAFADYLKKQMP